MPPKKNEASKKVVDKQKQKIIEDKTFGLKNKKGAKQQKYVQQVQKQVVQGNKSARDIERESEKANKKDAKKREMAELNDLFKPVAELQKCAQGVDPKSVLCVYFKQGTCLKGQKCKFSHDLTVERKSEKRNIYSESEIADGPMDNWDTNKLEEVVSTKHESTNKCLPPSTIICKYFLEAVENFKYGWFWECPNGASCHYRHALPSGFILKRDQKKMEEQKEVISLEDLIERERQNLSLNQTKVTFKTFLEWKKKKKMEKIKQRQADKSAREANYKRGHASGISGREVFEFDPTLVLEVVDNEDPENDCVVDSFLLKDDNCNDEDEYTGPLRDIDLTTFELEDVDLEEDGEGNVEDLIVPNGHCSLAQPASDQRSKNNFPGDVVIDDLVDESLFDEGILDDIEEEINELYLEP